MAVGRCNGRRAAWLAAPLAMAAVLLCARPASAKREYLERLQMFFRVPEAVGKCTFCHEVGEKDKPGKGNLGLYGKDLRAAFETNKDLRITPELGMVKLFEKDSDGDGVLNREEFALGTQPGNPKSIPAADKLAAYRKQVAEAAAKRAKPR